MLIDIESPLYEGNLPDNIKLYRHQLQMMQRMKEDETNGIIKQEYNRITKHYFNFINTKPGSGKTLTTLSYIYSNPCVPNAEKRLVISKTDNSFQNYTEYFDIVNFSNISIVVSHNKILNSVWLNECKKIGLDVINFSSGFKSSSKPVPVTTTTLQQKRKRYDYEFDSDFYNSDSEEMQIQKEKNQEDEGEKNNGSTSNIFIVEVINKALDELEEKYKAIVKKKKISRGKKSEKNNKREENVEETNKKFDRNKSPIVILVSETNFNFFISNHVKYARIIFDDIVDCNTNYNIPHMKTICEYIWPASFTWIINANHRNCRIKWFTKKTPFYSYLDSLIQEYSDKFIDVSDDYVEKSLSLPQIEFNNIVCTRSNIVNVLTDLPISPKIKEFLLTNSNIRDLNSFFLKKGIENDANDEEEDEEMNKNEDEKIENLPIIEFYNNLLTYLNNLTIEFLIRNKKLLKLLNSNIDQIEDDVFDSDTSILNYFNKLFQYYSKNDFSSLDSSQIYVINELINYKKKISDVENSKLRTINTLNDKENLFCNICFDSNKKFYCNSCQNIALCQFCYDYIKNKNKYNKNCETCPGCCQNTKFTELSKFQLKNSNSNSNDIYTNIRNICIKYKKIIIYLNSNSSSCQNSNIISVLKENNYTIKQLSRTQSRAINKHIDEFVRSQGNYCWLINSNKDIIGLNLQFIDAVVFIDIMDSKDRSQLIHRGQRPGREKSLVVYTIKF